MVNLGFCSIKHWSHMYSAQGHSDNQGVQIIFLKNILDKWMPVISATLKCKFFFYKRNIDQNYNKI